MKRTLLIAATSALVLAVGTFSALASSNLPKVLIGSASAAFVAKPKLIVYGTGFAFGRLRGGAYHSWLRWTAYTQTRAQAVGTVDINTCKPDCAGGRWITKRGTLTLSHPVLGRFTRDVLVYGHTTTRGQLTPFAENPLTWIWNRLLPAQNLSGSHPLPLSGETVKAQPGVYAIDYYVRPNGTPIETTYVSFTPSTATTVTGPMLRLTDPLTTDKIGRLLSSNPSPTGPFLFHVSYSNGIWTFQSGQ